MVRLTDKLLRDFNINLPQPEIDLRYRGIPGYCPVELMPHYTPEHFASRLPSNIAAWTREEIIGLIKEQYHPDSTKEINTQEKLW